MSLCVHSCARRRQDHLGLLPQRFRVGHGQAAHVLHCQARQRLQRPGLQGRPHHHGTVWSWYGVVAQHAGAAACLLPCHGGNSSKKPSLVPDLQSCRPSCVCSVPKGRPQAAACGVMRRPRQRVEAEAHSCTQCGALPGCRVTYVCRSPSPSLVPTHGSLQAWDVMNEPRCPGCLADAEVRDHLAFLRAAAAHLRATAPKQLVGQVSSALAQRRPAAHQQQANPSLPAQRVSRPPGLSAAAHACSCLDAFIPLWRAPPTPPTGDSGAFSFFLENRGEGGSPDACLHHPLPWPAGQ